MFNYVLILDICEEPDILKIILFVQKLLNIIFIIVPIALIVMLAIDVSKNVIISDESAQRKNMSFVVKRIFLCILMFLVPTFVNYLDNFLRESLSTFNVSYQSCYQNTSHIDYFESLKKLRIEEEKRQREEKLKNNKSVYDVSGAFSKLTLYIHGGNLTLNFNDLTEVSNATLSDLEKAFNNNENGEKAKNFLPYAAKYLELEKEYGVNVFFILGVHAWESDWLTSNVTKACNNLGGVKYAHQSGSSQCSATSEFASEGSYYAGWDSIEEFLDYYYPWVKKEYLTEGGDHYYGKSIEAFNTDYNGEQDWIDGVKKLSTSFFEAAKGQDGDDC